MAVAFTGLSWWLWSGKQKQPKISNSASLNPSSDAALLDLDSIKFPLANKIGSSSRKIKRKRHSREERKVDREYDVVVVPSDGGCVSGSESDDSDWSIGWLEPHGAAFQSDDDSDDSFAVLVPCYGRGRVVVEGNRHQNKFLDSIANSPDLYAAESKKYMEQWLSSLKTS